MLAVLSLLFALSPAIIATTGGRELSLTLPMLRALDGWDPSFRPWHDRDYQPLLVRAYRHSSLQAPFAVVGDFNGDGRADVAIDGRTNTHTVTIVLLSNHEAYRVIVIQNQRGVANPKRRPMGSAMAWSVTVFGYSSIGFPEARTSPARSQATH